MDAGRDWDVLAPRILTPPASQQLVVDTYSIGFDYHCLVEFRLSTPTEIPFYDYLVLGFLIPTNDFSFHFGTDHNSYLFTFYGDLDQRAEITPIITSSPDHFYFIEAPIDNLHFARIFLFIFERKWFFPCNQIDLLHFSRYRNSFLTVIFLLPAMD